MCIFPHEHVSSTDIAPRHEGAVWCVSWVRLSSLPFPPKPTVLIPPPTGPSQIWRHPRLLLLRRLRKDLARIPSLLRPLPLDYSRVLQPTHRLRKHCLLVTPRIRLPPCLRFVRRQCLGVRVPRGQLDASDISGAWGGGQCCELGAGDCAGEFSLE